MTSSTLLKKFKRLHRKAKGDLAELAFMLKAAALGMAVSKPYGDNQAFDLVVSPRRRGALRIQVKSGWALGENGYGYKVGLRSSVRRYRANEVDYFVAAILPEDAWYILPASATASTTTSYFYPHRACNCGQFEKYRNAWHLLTGDPADDTRMLGLTIRASADNTD
jgi:hypothetical protein